MKPFSDTSYNVHETVLSLLGKEPHNQKILDVGAGFGVLSKELKELNYDVTACEIDKERIKWIKSFGVKCDKVDLNKKLPYKDETFNIVCCVDVIEHMKSPYNLLQNISRVLRRNGTLIISTPNILNWYSRLKFLIGGVFNNYFTEKEFLGKGYHISPLRFFQLRWMLNQSGLKIEKITTNQYSGLVNFSYPKIFFCSILSSLLRPFMKPKNRELLEGDILIIKARKVKS